MSNQLFVKNLYAKCRIHGTGGAQVVISDAELHGLISLAIDNLNWDHLSLSVPRVDVPSSDYYKVPLAWFEQQDYSNAGAEDVIGYLAACFTKNNDFALFIENLSALHRRRVKYRRILQTQPLPTMDQIGPRALLEFGACDTDLQAHWMTWRKWVYDIDNRSAQETGYLFEPLLASCLGGEPVGARNSPVKRLDEAGRVTNKGRQIDCLVPSDSAVYEFKLRVTIAASGQGRFGEEMSFPVEAKAAHFKPILLVLDPTPSPRLTELAAKFQECGGKCFAGQEAWDHMTEKAGEVISVFIQRLVRPAMEKIEQTNTSELEDVTLSLKYGRFEVRSQAAAYEIERSASSES